MSGFWSRPAGIIDLNAPDYWQFFGSRLVEQAGIVAGGEILDVGCGDGSSLFPAAIKAGINGRVVGIDICPH
jgi:O-methyltransferase/aklanonic acid methyltransferase